MKLCSICKKNIAVVFTTKIEQGKSEVTGVCLECAKKMNIPVIDQLITQTGMSADDFENMASQMQNILQDVDMEDFESSNEMFSSFEEILKNSNADSENSSKSDSFVKSEKKDTSDYKKKIFNKKKNLEKYGLNLTQEAIDGKIDDVIGREKEINRVIQILNRRGKNNAILLGEPGVGKTAIAEGLALCISKNQVPSKLSNTQVYLLDLTAIVAGTQFRGQFEARMKAIIDEVKENKNIILVIDEIHNIIGAGDVQGGSMNAANILKPALAKGEIQLIGATTLDEYRKNIESDSALERRFQPIIVDEPSVEDSINILKGIKKYYEDFHEIKIPDSIVENAVKLSKQFINDRFLPDKAIDLIDEAGSKKNLSNLQKSEILKLEEKISKIRDLKAEAGSNNNFEEAAKYKMQEFNLEEEIKKLKNTYSLEALTIEDIAQVIEDWTGIPAKNVSKEESKKLLSLNDSLKSRIVSQEKAINSISKALKRNRSGFRKKKKPSSFIFVGPTGVGKTALVKALALEMFGSEDSLIRIDMSEYMEKHTVSKLIGAPPGYIGFDQGGQLTEKIRRKPYSVILLDEIEKAHPDVFHMLLQILDDGRLTDSQGRTVHFENSIIIMTSNAGSSFGGKSIGFAKSEYEQIEYKVKNSLEETFKPEFLNRVDEIIIFNPLNKNDLYSILEIMLEEVKNEAAENGFSIEITQSVKEFLIQKGYNSKYGARPLRRCIQNFIEDLLADEFLKGNLKSKKIILDFNAENETIFTSNR